MRWDLYLKLLWYNKISAITCIYSCQAVGTSGYIKHIMQKWMSISWENETSTVLFCLRYGGITREKLIPSVEKHRNISCAVCSFLRFMFLTSAPGYIHVCTDMHTQMHTQELTPAAAQVSGTTLWRHTQCSWHLFLQTGYEQNLSQSNRYSINHVHLILYVTQPSRWSVIIYNLDSFKDQLKTKKGLSVFK